MHDRIAPKTWHASRFQAKRTDAPALLPPVRGNLAELPGPDGIRWGLVNRIRAEIAAGTYDTEDRLALAEERMLARFAQ